MQRELPDTYSIGGRTGWNLVVYGAALALLFQLAWCIALVNRRVHNAPYPYDTFLFIPQVHFTDMTLFAPHFKHFGQGLAEPGWFQFSYPPVSALAFLPFMKSDDPVTYYTATVVAAILLFGYLLVRYGRGKPGFPWLIGLLVMTAAFSYPLMFLFDRANIEGAIWVVLAAGVAAYAGGWRIAAAVLLGIAAAMKIYPGAFLLLFVVRKQFWHAAIAAGTAVVSTVIALAAIGPTIADAFNYHFRGLGGFANAYALEYHRSEIGFDHSAFSLYKQFLAWLFGPMHVSRYLPGSSRAYLLLIVGVTVWLIWKRVWKMPMLNVLLFSCIVMIYFPFVSGDYTLVHLYIPWSIFVLYLLHDYWRDGRRPSQRTVLFMLVGFAVLFTPQSYLLVRPLGDQPIGLGGQLKALVLGYLLWASVSIPMGTSLFGDLESVEPRAEATVRPSAERRSRPAGPGRAPAPAGRE